MEEAIRTLKKNGWHVSLEKIKEQFDASENAADMERRFLRDPEKWIIDEDIKNVTVPCLPDKINSGKLNQINTPIVLQIKKLINIAAPKVNPHSEAAPRMLNVTLTDGKTTCHGIEFNSIPRLSLSTPPGTKIRLVGSIKVLNGFILLDAKNLQFLGGEVSELVDEWKVQQLLMGHVRSQNQDGPPPWVPFGQKIQPLKAGETTKSLLQEKEKEKEQIVKDEEFLSQRQDAIAAAASASGVTKVIRGSGRHLEMQPTERGGRGRGRGRESREERNARRQEERAATKPRDSIRLFEFLQPQITEQRDDDPNSDESDDGRTDSRHQEGNNWDRRGRGHFRGGRGGDREEFNQSGHRGPRGRRGGPNHGDSYRDRAPRGRESDLDRDWRGTSGAGYHGRGSSQYESEQSYRGRGQSYRDRRGSSRGGRRGSIRDIEDSYSSYRSHGDYAQKDIDTLVDDFSAWPGLETKAPSHSSGQVERHSGNVSKVQDKWAVEDYCLAKWESSDKYYPAVIQQLHLDRKSVTVMFIESGAVRLVEMKYLRRDPQDEDNSKPSYSGNSRGGQAGRIYTPRNRGMRGGGGGW